MTLDNTHYEILLTPKSFYVKEVEGYSSQSRIETLENINAIFQSCQKFFDSFEETEMTPKELSNIAFMIQERFSKEGSLSVSKQKEVDDLCTKIEENMKKFISLFSKKELQTVNPFSLPLGPMENIMNFLGVSNLKPLELVNKNAKKQVEGFSVVFFKNVLSQLEGFLEKYPEASLTEEELKGIISLKTEKNIFIDGELQELVFVKTEQDKITDKEILTKLKTINARISIDHLLKYFSCEGIYDPSFEELKLFLLKRKAWNYQKEKLQIALEIKLKELSNESSTSISLKKTIKVLIEKGADVSGALREAVETQNKFMSAALLECVVDINANYSFLDDDIPIHRRNLLMIAIEKGHQSMCKFLIDRGMSIHARSSQGMTALMVAAGNGHLSICEFLLEKGAKIEDKNEQGMTALMIAAENGNLSICELLLKKGANIEARDKNGWTPLRYAVKSRKEQVVEFLLEKPYKANVNIQSFLNKTLLMVLAYNSDEWEDDQLLSMSKLLLAYNPHLDIQDVYGNTALILTNEHSDLYSILIEKGADINIVNNSGRSALSGAIESRNDELFNILIGRKVKVNAVNKNKQTALMRAAREGNLSLLEQLIKLEAEVDLADDRGNTALMNAIEKRNLDCIQLLLNQDPKVNAQDINGETALMKAVRFGVNNKIFECLFDYGAEINIVSYREKQTAFMYAAELGNERICRLLFNRCNYINRYRDINVQNFEGNTALMLAVKRGYQSAAEILLRFKKCDLNIQNFEGNTALMSAIKREDLSLCELLIQYGAKKDQSILDYLEKDATEAFRKLFYELAK